MAHRVLVDAHVQVSPRITVSEGHRIAEAVRGRVRKAHHNVQDVLVHIDVETDMDGPRPGILPDREELTQVLADMLGARCRSRCRCGSIIWAARSRRSCIFRSSGFRRMIVLRLQARISNAAEEHPRSGRSCFMRWLHTDGASCFSMHQNGAFRMSLFGALATAGRSLQVSFFALAR